MFVLRRGTINPHAYAKPPPGYGLQVRCALLRCHSIIFGPTAAVEVHCSLACSVWRFCKACTCSIQPVHVHELLSD